MEGNKKDQVCTFIKSSESSIANVTPTNHSHDHSHDHGHGHGHTHEHLEHPGT